MLLADKIGKDIQIFAPNSFDTVSLTANTAYDVIINPNNKPDIAQYECSDNIQIALNDNIFGLPKTTNMFGISKDIAKISFTSEVDTTLYLSWQV